MSRNYRIVLAAHQPEASQSLGVETETDYVTTGTEDGKIAHSRDDDDILLELGRTPTPPQILEATVDAMCVRIHKQPFTFGEGEKKYKKECLVFDFRVIEPTEHRGKKLQMFVHFKPDWRQLPRAAKMLEIVTVAVGRERIDPKIRKSWFLRQVFRCKLQQVGKAPASSTIIKTLLSKLTGPSA